MDGTARGPRPAPRRRPPRGRQLLSAAHGVDGDRLLADLRTLRGFGADGAGVRRPALSPADVAAREWLVTRLTDAGLDANVDGLGTVIGRSPVAGPALLVGSHSDSQPLGGWLDGAYGVICALEVARACPGLPIDVVSWQDEEGAFRGFVGSRTFAGEDMALDLAEMEDGLRAAGWWGRPLFRHDGRHRAYLEPHIEQGGRLEAAGLRLGVVTGIVGIRQYELTFRGRRNHAGTTPMAMREDASVAMVAFLAALDRAMADAAGPDSVWTHGRMHVEPGAPSVIPDIASVTVQFRDADSGVLARLDTAFHGEVARAADRGARVELAEDSYQVEPAVMDPALRAHVAAACEEVAPGGWMEMPSGAAHDAQVVSAVVPASMVFVPSIGGISHAVEEHTSDDDLVLGCRAVAAAAQRILRG